MGTLTCFELYRKQGGCQETYDLSLIGNKQNECDASRDLIPFVQFKRREKHPWKSVNFSKVAGFSLYLYN